LLPPGGNYHRVEIGTRWKLGPILPLLQGAGGLANLVALAPISTRWKLVPGSNFHQVEKVSLTRYAVDAYRCFNIYGGWRFNNWVGPGWVYEGFNHWV